MRDYGKVAPQFWTGATGKALRDGGPEAVIVGLYLMTSPHANMIGLYYLPMLYLAHETGLGIEGARKGLQRASEAGFCSYDEASEHVFVHAMARFQIADSLDPKDNRCKGVANELSKVPKGPLVQAFLRLYASAYHLQKPDNLASPIEGASKPLASQEQEQEQEQEKDTPPKKTGGRPKVALKTFIAERKAEGADAIAADDPVYAYADTIGLPDEFIALAWRWFVPQMEGKRQKDWPAHFRNAVKGNWPKYWYAADGGWALTTAGKQAQMEARA